jgi:voltage-gated potassium channel
VESINRYIYQLLAVAVAVLLASGMVFFHVVEKLSWVNAYYFCVVTLSTVGYGDIVPKTDVGKVGDTVYIILGVGILTSFISATMRRRGEKMRERRGSDSGGPRAS